MADKIPLKLTTGPNEIQEFAAGDTVGTAHLPSTVVYTSGAQTLVDKTLDPTTVASRLMAVGGTPARVVEFGSTGTATNYDAVKLTTQAAGNGAIVSPVSSATDADLRVEAKGSGNVYVQGNGVAVGTTGTQTLTNKTLSAPIIGATDFGNANHNHQGGPNGGFLTTSALNSGTFNQTFVADAAYRTGSYAYGRGSSVLIDNVAGSGQAQWANRPRVLQVQTGSYTVTPSPTAFTTFSVYSAVLGTTGGVTMNTTPDCLVDTTGGAAPSPSGATRAGKVFKVTYTGRFTASTATIKTLSLQLEFENNALISKNTVTGATSAIAVTDGRFRGSGYVMFTVAQNGTGTVRVWQEIPLISGVGSGPAYGVYDAANSIPETSMTIADGSTIYIRIKAAISASVAPDAIIVDNVIYEALN